MRLAAVALVVLLVPFVAVAAAAGPVARSATTLASYCSSSGDVCFGVVRRAGVIRAEITTAAHYFNRYTLCVRPPGTGGAGLRRCGSFPVFRQGGSTWGSSVRLARQFPLTEPGICRVTWKLASGPLGPTLRFRLR
jgi:hypothetical protein